MLNPKSLSAACVLMTSVTTLAGPCGPCTADIDDGTHTGTRDGGVTIEDLLYFLDSFSNGTEPSCRFIVCMAGGEPCIDDTGVPVDCCTDTTWRYEALFFYLALFEQGC